MSRFLWLTSVLFLASACGGREIGSRFQGVVKEVVKKDRKDSEVKGHLYFEDIILEGFRRPQAWIQWTDETRFFLTEGKHRKQAQVEDIKPGMRVEVILMSKGRPPPEDKPAGISATAVEILILEKE